MSIWPPLIYIALTFYGLGTIGRKELLNWVNVISQVLIWALLWWGSFFDPLLRFAQ